MVSSRCGSLNRIAFIVSVLFLILLCPVNQTRLQQLEEYARRVRETLSMLNGVTGLSTTTTTIEFNNNASGIQNIRQTHAHHHQTSFAAPASGSVAPPPPPRTNSMSLVPGKPRRPPPAVPPPSSVQQQLLGAVGGGFPGQQSLQQSAVVKMASLSALMTTNQGLGGAAGGPGHGQVFGAFGGMQLGRVQSASAVGVNTEFQTGER
jgi:hypothetical protein